MKAFKSIIVLSLALTSLSAFADTTDGGHDGGGANLWTSSREQVHAAIKWAFHDMYLESPNVLFWASPRGPKFKRKDGEEVSVGQCLVMPIVCRPVQDLVDDIDSNRPHFSKVRDYLSLSKLTLKEDGPCPAPDKKHAAGSVSAFKPGADLCLSVSELSRTVPGGLRAQVTSVLAHEMAHLMGFDEATAFALQKAIVENFGTVSRSDGAFLAYRLEGNMWLVEAAFLNGISLSEANGIAMGTYLLGMAEGQLKTIFDMLPDGINDNTIPAARPELYQPLKDGFRSLQWNINQLASKAAAGKLTSEQFSDEVRKLITQLKPLSQMLKDFLGRRVD